MVDEQSNQDIQRNSNGIQLTTYKLRSVKNAVTAINSNPSKTSENGENFHYNAFTDMVTDFG